MQTHTPAAALRAPAPARSRRGLARGRRLGTAQVRSLIEIDERLKMAAEQLDAAEKLATALGLDPLSDYRFARFRIDEARRTADAALRGWVRG
jgi:hypothetical protein